MSASVKSLIIFSGRPAVGELKQIAQIDALALGYRLPPPQICPQSADAVNQNILVVNRRQTLHARDHFQPMAVTERELIDDVIDKVDRVGLGRSLNQTVLGGVRRTITTNHLFCSPVAIFRKSPRASP